VISAILIAIIEKKFRELRKKIKKYNWQNFGHSSKLKKDECPENGAEIGGGKR
jgi:hypothetical protein